MTKRVLKMVGIAAALLGLVVLIVVGVGSTLPVEHTATLSDTVSAPLPEVWLAVTDVERYPSWRSGVERSEWLTDGDGSGVGRRWQEDGPEGPLTFEIEEMWREERLVTRIADEGLPFGGRWIYAFEPIDGGVVVTLTEEGEVYSPIYRFVSTYVIGHERTMRGYLDDLTAHFGPRE